MHIAYAKIITLLEEDMIKATGISGCEVIGRVQRAEPVYTEAQIEIERLSTFSQLRG